MHTLSGMSNIWLSMPHSFLFQPLSYLAPALCLSLAVPNNIFSAQLWEKCFVLHVNCLTQSICQAGTKQVSSRYQAACQMLFAACQMLVSSSWHAAQSICHALVGNGGVTALNQFCNVGNVGGMNLGVTSLGDSLTTGEEVQLKRTCKTFLGRSCFSIQRVISLSKYKCSLVNVHSQKFKTNENSDFFLTEDEITILVRFKFLRVYVY